MRGNKVFLVSIFLHCFVFFCIALYIFMDDIFEEEIEEKFVFEMVEPPPMDDSPVQADVQDSPVVEEVVEDFTVPEPENLISKIEIKEAKPIEMPDIVPVPKPEPKPVPKVEVKPKVVPIPPKKVEIKPKVEVKPTPPKKVDIASYNKTKVKPKVTVQPKIKIDSIKNSGGNLSHTSVTSSSNLNLADLNTQYINSLKRIAKANYTLPNGAKGMNLSVEIAFNVLASGKVSGVRILKSSGNVVFDNSVKSLFSGLKSVSPPSGKAIENIRLTFESN